MAKYILKMGGHIQDEPDGQGGTKEVSYRCAKPNEQPTVVESETDLQQRFGSEKFELHTSARQARMKIPPRPQKELATREEYEAWLVSLDDEQLRMHAVEREIDSSGDREELLARIKEQ